MAIIIRSTQLRYAILALGLQGCAHVQPQFIEPAWGDAPAPYAAEVTEITLEYRHCGATAARCTTEQVVLRRDGRASRTFLTASKRDSLLHGTIDSTAFIQLVEVLRSAVHFTSRGNGRHEPLTVDSYIVSAATLCRRALRDYSPSGYQKEPTPAVPAAVLEAANRITWGKCCRLDLWSREAT